MTLEIVILEKSLPILGYVPTHNRIQIQFRLLAV